MILKSVENKDFHRERIGSLESLKIEVNGDLEYAKIDNDQPEIDRLQKTLDKTDVEIAKQKSMLDSAPLGRSDYKESLKQIDFNLNIGIPVDIKRATNKGDLEIVKQLQEKQQQLELQRQDLIDNMPPVQFADLKNPTSEEFHDHIWGSRTLGEAIDKTLSVKGLGGIGQRLLAKALRKSDFISNAKLELVKDVLKYTDKNGKEKLAAGLYHGGSDHRVQLGKSSSITELLHEAMHAGTHKLLDDKTSPAAIEMHKLFNKYQQEHITKYEENLDRFKEENPNATLEQLNKFKEDNDPYGFENVHEFVAEAFTNKDFQELLSKIDVRERKNNVLSNIVENKNITRKETGEKIGGKLRKDAEGNPLRIDIDVDHLYQQFEDKPWTTPKVEGVEPLPENTFKTPQEWVDFVIQHEAEHVKTPIKEGQIAAMKTRLIKRRSSRNNTSY